MSDQNHAAGAPSANVTPSSPPRSRVAWLLGIGLLMAAVIGVVVYWQQQAGTEAAPAVQMMPPPEVTVAAPVFQEIVEWDEYTGQFSAVDKVELRARVSGYIESIHFQDGQIVNAGDLLFVIDRRPYEIDLESAKARYDEAAARLDVATRQLERTSKLRKSDFAAATEFDERTSEAAGSQGGIGGGAGGGRGRGPQSGIHPGEGADQRPHRQA